MRRLQKPSSGLAIRPSWRFSNDTTRRNFRERDPMWMSSCEPFAEVRLPLRERLLVAANDNSALHHHDLSILDLIPADDRLTKIAAKAEPISIAAAVGIAISLFIGPVVFSCLMLGVWSAALDSNGGKHDRGVYDVGNQGGGFARQAEGSQAQHG
ncbi:hypothetical protein LB572_06255 [Mesorhizobium sp. BH1-1-5]|uniref:hypothetical protein n=1 Tax=Mesorhizobium sp. BH1-1-5 TaxID=2876661 RepID=UPI001CCCA9F2|nr:hypothetical protein [Mesorhizobium sp. BH1-1-5]MBZ9986697.1 hypothetical protein [Mesorhizobium sp. BH1-1-5]